MRILFHDLTVPPEPWLGFLRQAFPQASVELWQPGAAPADYALVWAPPQQLLDEQTQLKALFQIAAGVDALLKLRLPIGVPVFRLDDAGMAVQMAEYVCHAVIRHFRELDKVEADTRAGRWQQRQPRSRAEFSVGVLGLGVLGQRVLKALEAFEFPLRGWGRTPRHLNGVQTFAGPQELPGFLAASRVLVNLLPLTPETENLLNTQTLSQLQPGGYLINVARGRHLVDEDLLALLGSGHLAGATWMCSARNRCPQSMLFGAMRASPSRRTPRPARCARTAWPRSWPKFAPWKQGQRHRAWAAWCGSK